MDCLEARVGVVCVGLDRRSGHVVEATAELGRSTRNGTIPRAAFTPTDAEQVDRNLPTAAS